ncbi:MAG: DNA translocase FtsK [Spirulinaceae cyanobacterium]
MPYLTDSQAIWQTMNKLTQAKVLWLDTEVADWRTKNPRLSLIQALVDAKDVTGEKAYVLDILQTPDLINYFISQIMVNPQIEKVFHNAAYDLRFLGKNKAKNITCTLKLAKSNRHLLPGVTNLKLKTLATELCNFPAADIEPQGSDWGKRPLTATQLNYAQMDVVYLAQLHNYLLKPTLRNIIKKALPPLSVTKVCLAFECPRLFYLGQKYGGKTMFVPPNKSPGIGKIFHQLSDRFVNSIQKETQFQQLLIATPQQLNATEVAQKMQELLYELAFFPYLQNAIRVDPAKAQPLYTIWQGLQNLIARWAELLVTNRSFCSAEEVISKTFIAQELDIHYKFLLSNGEEQLIKGRFDSLVYDFSQHRLCVVDYKTYHSPDKSAQLAQVALYGYMLKNRVGVPIDSAVYTVLPDWQELTLTWEQLEATIHQLIPEKLQQIQQWLNWQQSQPNPPPATSQPELLCPLCPQQQKCRTFFPNPPLIEGKSTTANSITKPKVAPTQESTLPTNLTEAKTPITESQPTVEVNIPETQTTPQTEPIIAPQVIPKNEPTTTAKPVEETNTNTEPQSTKEADKIGEQLVAILQSFKLNVEYLGAALGPAFIRVKIKPNLGVKVSSLLRLADDLQVQLGINNPPLITPQAGYVSVDLPRPKRQTANFETYIQPESLPATAPVKIAIGINLNNQLIEANLADSNTCHFLVGGTTGSGKSEFLRALLLSLLNRHPPNQLKIALVDPKRVTFPEFEKMPWLLSPVVKDSDRAIELMEKLVVEMERRYQLFELNSCPNLTAYNQHLAQQQKKPEPPIICIFDEYADFMVEKETRKTLEQSIKRLGAMARAAGIHLIIATQRPEASVVTPIIRSNLPGRIALRTASEADSEIILGGKQKEAAYLLGKGDLLFLTNAKLERLQSLYAEKIKLKVNN